MWSIFFFRQNMCEHDILKFKTHEMIYLLSFSPFFISYLMGKICHAQVVTDASLNRTFFRRLHTTFLITFNLYKALFNILNLHPSVLRCWVHHTSDTCTFTLARTTLVKHLNINVHVLLYLSPFFFRNKNWWRLLLVRILLWYCQQK